MNYFLTNFLTLLDKEKIMRPIERRLKISVLETLENIQKNGYGGICLQ